MTLIPWILLALQQMAAMPEPAPEPARAEREAWVMGTRLHIVVEGVSTADGRRLGESALREIERFEALLGTWGPTTPLARLNRSPVGEWRRVDGELEGLLLEAAALSSRTGGTFEHRIGALTDAWGLRGQSRRPGPEELLAALTATGPASVELAEGALRRSSEAAWIDAGAFGKGAALRSVERLLREGEAGSELRALVDLGGQLLAVAPADAPWTVHVAHPLRRSESAAGLTVLRGSVATSGASERGRHILDPRTGLPVEAWGSVTVVHADALAADALSTALYVMGPSEGSAWAEAAGVAALFLAVDEVGIGARATPAIRPWLIDINLPDESGIP